MFKLFKYVNLPRLRSKYSIFRTRTGFVQEQSRSSCRRHLSNRTSRYNMPYIVSFVWKCCKRIATGNPPPPEGVSQRDDREVWREKYEVEVMQILWSSISRSLRIWDLSKRFEVANIFTFTLLYSNFTYSASTLTYRDTYPYVQICFYTSECTNTMDVVERLPHFFEVVRVCVFVCNSL